MTNTEETSEHIADLIKAAIDADPRGALELLTGKSFEGREIIVEPMPQVLMSCRCQSGLTLDSVAGNEIVRTTYRRALENSMWALLRAKFGDVTDLDDLADRLSGQDHNGNLARIVNGATLEELRG